MGFVNIDAKQLYQRAGDPRLSSILKIGLSHLTSDSFALAGYPDDEGITLNLGRPGARFAPDVIRSFLYKMTPPFDLSSHPRIVDIGNLSMTEDLSSRHNQVSKIVEEHLNSGGRWIGVGGGHDYGYADGHGFLNSTYVSNHRLKPLIINVDAHLDVRSTEQGLSSGTPFFRLLSEHSDFLFYQVGIQKQCNQKQHLDWCKDRGANILTFDQIALSPNPFSMQLSDFIGSPLLKPHPTFLSIDIDGFSSSYAMGCSQSWPTGLHPNEFWPALHLLLQRLDVRVFSVYEVSPPLDSDHRTAKLASQLIYEFLFHSSGPKQL